MNKKDSPTLTNITTLELEDAIREGATLIDIRRPDEWINTGLIKGALTIQAITHQGALHPEFLDRLNQAVPTKNTPLIIYCHAASRTEHLGRALIEQLGFTDVAHLSGGIIAWLDDGRKTTPYQDKKP